MFSFLANLFGCSNNKQKAKEKDQIDQSFQDFLNRPIYKVLTADIVDSVSDDDLLQVVFDNLCEKLPEEDHKWNEVIMSWNKSRQVVYLVWWLEAEVNNGGFNQFYFNSIGQYAELYPELLRLIRAVNFAELVERANEIYKKENDKITEAHDGSLEGFMESYKDNPLNELDQEFYKLYEKEHLSLLLVDYIRQNKTDFVDK